MIFDASLKRRRVERQIDRVKIVSEFQRCIPIDSCSFLAELIILSVHTGLLRGSLFHLRWDQVDFLNRVLRIQRTKSGRPHALPLNATVLTTLQALYNERIPDCPYAFAHATGRKALVEWNRIFCPSGD